MKRFVIVVLLLCLAFSAYGCRQKAKEINDEDPITEYDDVDEIPVDALRGTITVKKKQLKYNELDVVILRIENQTEYDCNLTIDGNYKNTEGESIKGESYEFKGLCSGDSNYAVFYPAISFSDFSYKINVQKSEAGSYSKYLKFGATGSAVAPAAPPPDLPAYLADTVGMPTVRLQSNYSGTQQLYISAKIVIFDNKGEIVEIDNNYSGKATSGWIDRGIPIKCNKKGDEYILPDNLTGELAVIVALIEIKDSI